MSAHHHAARAFIRCLPGFWSTAALAVALMACQASGAEPTERQSTSEAAERSGAAQSAEPTQSAEQDASEAPPLRVGEIASVTTILTGARDTTFEGSSAAGNVQPGGGCRSDQMLRMSFTFMPPDHSSESRVSWEVGSPMDPGATGTFSVESVSYWDSRMGLPSQNAFQGSGTLELTRHDAGPGPRRMTGRLVAEGLSERSGQTVDVDVSFDIGGSCGTIQ